MTRVKLILVRDRRRKVSAITCPQDAFAFLGKEAKGLDREHFWRIDLDARNTVLGYEVVSIGTLTASLVHPREVFKGALLANASGIIIAHNHPSGDASPSPEDRETTRRIQNAGQILGVPLLDHIILADTKCFSFRETGLL